jgi:hypothetical protein
MWFPARKDATGRTPDPSRGLTFATRDYLRFLKFFFASSIRFFTTS